MKHILKHLITAALAAAIAAASMPAAVYADSPAMPVPEGRYNDPDAAYEAYYSTLLGDTQESALPEPIPSENVRDAAYGEKWDYTSLAASSKVSIDTDTYYSDTGYSIKIESTDYNIAAVGKTFAVKPDTKYLFTAKVKYADLEKAADAQYTGGAYIGQWWSYSLSPAQPDNEWTELSYSFTTGASETEYELGLYNGLWNTHCKGTAWFSDIKLKEFEGTKTNEWNILTIIYRNVDIPSITYGGKTFSYKNSYTDEDVEEITDFVNVYYDAFEKCSGGLMKVKNIDVVTTDAPINELAHYDWTSDPNVESSYSIHGYRLSADLKCVRDEMDRFLDNSDKQYNIIFWYSPIGAFNGWYNENSTSGWAGLNGSYKGMYTAQTNYNGGGTLRSGTFPEETLLHEICHKFEGDTYRINPSMYVELHSRERHGYSGKENAETWYSLYMQGKVDGNKGIDPSLYNTYSSGKWNLIYGSENADDLKKTFTVESAVMPTRRTFVIGETIEPSGGYFLLKFTDGTESKYSIRRSMLTGADTSSAGQKTVTVTFDGKEYKYDITVYDRYNVTFETNGAPAIAAQSLGSGEKVSKPAAPSYAGYRFGGWYSDPEFTKPYDFNATVTDNMTLYAQWAKVASADKSFTIEEGILTKYYGTASAITIPSDVREIDPQAIRSGIITSISADPQNKFFTSVDGVLFSKDKKTLVAYPSGRKTDYFVPSGTISIAPGAFLWASVKNVTLPDGLESIGYWGFWGCASLKSISFPLSVKSIDLSILTKATALKDIYYEGTKEQFERITRNSDVLPANTLIHYNSKPLSAFAGKIELNGTEVYSLEAAFAEIKDSAKRSSGTPSYTVTITPDDDDGAEIVFAKAVSLPAAAVTIEAAKAVTLTVPGITAGGSLSLKNIIVRPAKNKVTVTIKGAASLTDCEIYGDLKLSAKADKTLKTVYPIVGSTITGKVTSNNSLTFTDCVSVGNVTVKGNMTVSGTGTTKAGKTAVSADLNAQGCSFTGAVTVKGNAVFKETKISGKLTVNKSVSFA